MRIKIDYLKSQKVEASDNWSGTLEQAKSVAKSAVESGNCDVAEVRDDAGKLLYCYPRTLKSG